MSRALMYQLNLRSGGSDLACDEHLDEAKRERGPDGDGSLFSVAEVATPGETCPYCGVEWDEER